MHIVYDENGNPCPHGHEHEHTHTHTYEHSHVHSHEHGHEDDHHHTHERPEEAPAGCEAHCGGYAHAQGAPAAECDRMTALLDYMLKHNQSHAAELDKVAEQLRAQGKDAAAEQVKKAVDEFQKGNLYLSLALSLVKEV